jgi:hypothetical protein
MKPIRVVPLVTIVLVLLIVCSGIALWGLKAGAHRAAFWYTDAGLVKAYAQSMAMPEQQLDELERRLSQNKLSPAARSAFHDANIKHGLMVFGEPTYRDLAEGRLTADQVKAIFELPPTGLMWRRAFQSPSFFVTHEFTGWYAGRLNQPDPFPLDATTIELTRPLLDLEESLLELPGASVQFEVIACEVGGVKVDPSRVDMGEKTVRPSRGLTAYPRATVTIAQPLADVGPQRPVPLRLATRVTFTCTVQGEHITKTLPLGIDDELYVFDKQQTRIAERVGTVAGAVVIALTIDGQRVLGVIDENHKDYTPIVFRRRGDTLEKLGQFHDQYFGPRWLEVPGNIDLQVGDGIELRDVVASGESTLLATWPLTIVEP